MLRHARALTRIIARGMNSRYRLVQMAKPRKETWEFDIVDSRRTLTILAVGRIGSGKSALINGLVGSEVAKEADETLDAQTEQLTSYSTTKRGIAITIWDAPGLETVRTPQELENFVQDLAGRVGEVDLLMYCTRMDEHRLRPGDTQTIRVMTKAFGKLIWKNAVFVLTFANMVEAPKSKSSMGKPEYFQEKLSQWKNDLRRELRTFGVSDDLAGAVPVVPAGYYDEPTLLNGRNWLSDFWHVCFESIKESAQPALLEANMERLKATEEIQKYQYQLPIEQQPIETRPGLTNSLLTSMTAQAGIATAGSATVGGVTGFVIGGGIGAVAGCGIGAVGAAAAYALYKNYFQ